MHLDLESLRFAFDLGYLGFKLPRKDVYNMKLALFATLFASASAFFAPVVPQVRAWFDIERDFGVQPNVSSALSGVKRRKITCLEGATGDLVLNWV